ncbi:hypothetical protein ES703_114358 [subsurface metagenome]
MTRKGETGQAFILVLILLAIGALLIVPALRLTGTSLKSSQILARHVRAMYAADGAQEYVLWKLAYDPDYAASFTVEGQSDNFSVDICGKQVDVTVVMRAVPGQGGMTLATDHVIQPTKTVTPDTATKGVNDTFEYIIKLEQLSDNTTQGLDVIYDILPADLKTATANYETGSSELRVDGGAWQPIDDPEVASPGGQYRLRWPASGNFTSPMRDFAVRQVKELKFKMHGRFLADSTVQCNWVVLKMGDIITLSGPQAPITVGSVPPEEAGVCDTGGLLDVSKVSDPLVIQPGVETDIEYTVSITNQSGSEQQIQEITDYLPPGFTYTDNSTGGITTADPYVSLQTINGVERYVLEWAADEFPPDGHVKVKSGDTELLTFWAYATKDVSGSYYNEVIVIPNVSAPAIFSGIGVSDEDYYTNYSWNTGTVIVPAYDSQTDAGDISIDANMALTLDSISITSWQIY